MKFSLNHCIEQVDLDRFTFPNAPNEGQQENDPKLSFVDLTFNPIKSPNCTFLKSCAINTESEYFSDHIYGHVSSNLMDFLGGILHNSVK